MKPALRGRLRQRGLGWIADDVLANVGLELARLYSGHPRPDDLEEFARMVSRIARFRASDELRARFRRRLLDQSPGYPEEIADPQGGEEQLIHELDARAFLLGLIDGLDQLPADDRALLTRPLEEGAVAPLSGKERVRIIRLRRQLLDRLAARIRGGESGQ